MSKAGGIAYLIKHGKAAMPTVTRTAMPRAKGIKRMADGGLSNANVPLNYGTVPDYVFVPGGMEVDERTGKPVWRSGRYEIRKAANAPAAAGATGSVGVPTVRPDSGSGAVSSGGKADVYGGMDSGSNPDWDATNNALNNAKAITQAVTDRFGLSTTNADRLANFLGLDTESQTLAKLAEVGPLSSLGYSQLGGVDPATAVQARLAAEAQETSSGGLGSMGGGWSPDQNSAATNAEMAASLSSAGYYSPPDSGNTGSGADTSGGYGGVDSGGYSGDGSGGYYASGGHIKRMATGGIGALADQGGFVGSYAKGGRMLRGPGDGLSDNIPAVIGKNKPARLADGEFVVSADVVSSLGGGSTEAGARKLYAMMDRIRQNAHGTKKQVKKVNERKVLPA